MALDFDGLIDAALFAPAMFGEDVQAVYTPANPGAPSFAVDVIFDPEHEVVLDEVAKSEMRGAGHSTTAVVATVRLRQFPAPPRAKDGIVITAKVFGPTPRTYQVYDVQADGRGCADLVLRETKP